MCMKKAQVLCIYMDNCATGDTVDQLATGFSVDTNASPLSTSPTTRWGIAAELNILASRAFPTTFSPPPMTTTFLAHARPSVYNLRSAMEKLERSTGVSLRAATAEAYRWRRCSTSGVASESLPEVETVSATMKTAIIDLTVKTLTWLHC